MMSCKKVLSAFAMLMLSATGTFAQIAPSPLSVSITFKGNEPGIHANDECTGTGLLNFTINAELQPTELSTWSDTRHSWEGNEPGTLTVPSKVDCKDGDQRTFSSVYKGPYKLATNIYVSIDLSEDEGNRYHFSLGSADGMCMVTQWVPVDQKYEQRGPFEGTSLIAIEGTEVNPMEGGIREELRFTKSELAKGFQRNYQPNDKDGQTFCDLPYGGTWTIKLSYTPNEKGATVALTGCTDIVVGGATNLKAVGTPKGGTFEFTSSNPDVAQLLPLGAAATLTGLQPGSATVEVKYKTPDGATGTASEVVHCVQVKSINNNTPVVAGLYDAKGNKKDLQLDVPVDVVPAEGARRIIYKPLDARLTAVSTSPSTLTLSATAPVKTMVQAETSCGVKTGAPVAVDIVPCDGGVITEVRREEELAKRKFDATLKEMAEILGDPEFERAANEGAGHIRDVAQKTIELLGKLAAQAGGGSMAERMRALAGMSNPQQLVKGIDQISDALAISEMLDNALNDNYDAAAKAAGEMAEDKIWDMITNNVWGIVKGANDAAQASAALGQDLGTMFGAADRLKELEQQLTEEEKELLRIRHVLYDLCKEKRKAEEKPKPKSDAPPKKSEPAARKPQTASGKPKTDKKAEDKTAPSERTPPKTDAPPVDRPSEDSKKPGTVGLLADEDETQCKATSVRELDSMFSGQRKNTFEPLQKQAEGTREILRDFIGAAHLPATQKKERFDALRTKMKENPPKRFIEFAQQLEDSGRNTKGCAKKLENSFTVDIDELKTRY